MTALQSLIGSSQSSDLVIPAELLGFGVAYTFTVILKNMLGVSRSINSTSFITFGGSNCVDGYSYPDFAITSNFCLVITAVSSIDDSKPNQ
mgnify:FL=1